MIEISREAREKHRAHITSQIKLLFNFEDISGLEIFFTLNRLAQLSEILDCQWSEMQDVSGPRWRLLLRLFMAEHLGNHEGMTPTVLSHWQRVSKNTVSALLRGLEEQGLVVRKTDPKDLRIFRIYLTDTGREYVLRTAPKRIEGMNQMLSGLTTQEVKTLSRLLEKLHHSLQDQVDQLQKDQVSP